MIMNKRFSTLLAGVLVAGGLSANAQNIDGSIATELVSSPARNYMLTTTQFTSTPSGPIGTVLFVDDDNYVQTMTASPTDVNKQLWTIEVKAVSGSNRFVLRNKATGLTLSFDPANAIKADENGDVAAPTSLTAEAAEKASSLTATDSDTEWTWVPNTVSGLNNVRPLTCAFRTDSTMGLFVARGGYLYAYKYANTKVPQTSNLPTGASV